MPDLIPDEAWREIAGDRMRDMIRGLVLNELCAELLACREALRFYANGDHYEWRRLDTEGAVAIPLIEADDGARARACLPEHKGEGE